MTAFVDTNVLVRHFTNDPPSQAARATARLEGAEDLVLTDLIVAEMVYVLESVYRASRSAVRSAVASLLEFDSIRCIDAELLRRAAEIYEVDRINFAEAYLAACAETTGLGEILSFDRTIDRVKTVARIEP